MSPCGRNQQKQNFSQNRLLQSSNSRNIFRSSHFLTKSNVKGEPSRLLELSHAEMHESLVSGMLTFDTSLCKDVIESTIISKSLEENIESECIPPPNPSDQSTFSFSTVSLCSDEVSVSDLGIQQRQVLFRNDFYGNTTHRPWDLLQLGVSNWSVNSEQHLAFSLQSSSLSFRTASLREDELSLTDENNHSDRFFNYSYDTSHESDFSPPSSDRSHILHPLSDSSAQSDHSLLSFYTASLREGDMSSMDSGSRRNLFVFDSGYLTHERHRERDISGSSHAPPSPRQEHLGYSYRGSEHLNSNFQSGQNDLELINDHGAENLSLESTADFSWEAQHQTSHSSGESIMTSNIVSQREIDIPDSEKQTLLTEDTEQLHINNQQEMGLPVLKFLKETLNHWFKPEYTREQVLELLYDKPAGSFVVRESQCFPGAFGLALKVEKLPPNVRDKPGGDLTNEYIRHFLIESSSRGIRLRGCPNEPVFECLSSLIYQHSITPLSLPCKLLIPTVDHEIPQQEYTAINRQADTLSNTPATATTPLDLIEQAAACNVIYIGSANTESLTGPKAIDRAVRETYKSARSNPNQISIVHFKVSSQGITLTDNTRRLFFRRHYLSQAITFCGLDPQGFADKRQRRRRLDASALGGRHEAWLFGFVARTQAGSRDNTCHVFAELDPIQPARAIVDFVMKILN